ncbi:uncharacterized protein KZ484_020200 [Pholidichthys leucotaenia]
MSGGGMSVLSGRALQEQLSVIMAALTKAAVAEICELVEEGYAVFQLEISRSHQENQDLRKKLQLIESIVVRGSSSSSSSSGGSGEEAHAGVAEAEQTGEVSEEQPESPTQRRGGDGADAAAAAARGEAGDILKELPDVVLIKDEDSDSDTTLEEGHQTPADSETTASRNAATSLLISRRTKRRWRENCQAKNQKSSGQPEQKISELPVYSLDSPHNEPDCSSQLEQEVEMDSGDSVCHYQSEMDPDVHVVQECSTVPPNPSNRPVYFSGGTMVEPNRAELDLNIDPTWVKQSKGPMAFAPFHQNENADRDVYSLKLVSVSGSGSSDCQLSENSRSAFEYEDGGDVINFTLYRDQAGQPQPCDDQPGGSGSSARGKRFLCSVCNRTYATSQNLEVHMRIHTGERPFSCNQCGKKFTQSAHLKSHMSIHTGERPYPCTFCSRSFIVKYSLNLHMKKCHPNVPNVS